jgi:hypothetical protein
LAESFSDTGQGRHSEGYVVRFHAINGESWVGNFHSGLSGYCGVTEHPNGRDLIVISCGQGYVVDPDDRNKREYLDASIETILPVPELGILVFGNGLWFEAVGTCGFAWGSQRISWDGMKELRREGTMLSGLAWSPLEDDWTPFELDLTTGSHRGGSYNGP